MKLNAPEALGLLLKEAGIETVKIVPTRWISNECKEAIVSVSIQEGSRIYKQIEHLMKYKDENDQTT